MANREQLLRMLTFILSGKTLCPRGRALPHEDEAALLELIRQGVLTVEFSKSYSETATTSVAAWKRARAILFLRDLKKFRSGEEERAVLGHVGEAGVPLGDCLSADKTEIGYLIYTSRGTLVIEHGKASWANPDVGKTVGRNATGHRLPRPGQAGNF